MVVHFPLDNNRCTARDRSTHFSPQCKIKSRRGRHHSIIDTTVWQWSCRAAVTTTTVAYNNDHYAITIHQFNTNLLFMLAREGNCHIELVPRTWKGAKQRNGMAPTTQRWTHAAAADYLPTSNETTVARERKWKLLVDLWVDTDTAFSGRQQWPPPPPPQQPAAQTVDSCGFHCKIIMISMTASKCLPTVSARKEGFHSLRLRPPYLNGERVSNSAIHRLPAQKGGIQHIITIEVVGRIFPDANWWFWS